MHVALARGGLGRLCGRIVGRQLLYYTYVHQNYISIQKAKQIQLRLLLKYWDRRSNTEQIVVRGR